MTTFKSVAIHSLLIFLMTACSTVEVSKAPSDLGVHQLYRQYRSGICDPIFVDRSGARNWVLQNWRDNGGFRSAGVLVGYENSQRRGQSCHVQSAAAYQGKFQFPIGDVPDGAIITDARLEFRSRTVFVPAYGIQDASYCRDMDEGRFFALVGTPTAPLDTSRHSSGPLIDYDNPVHLPGSDVAGPFVRRSMDVTRRVQFARRNGTVVDIVISPVDEWVDRPFDATANPGLGTHCAVWIRDAFLFVTYATSP